MEPRMIALRVMIAAPTSRILLHWDTSQYNSIRVSSTDNGALWNRQPSHS